MKRVKNIVIQIFLSIIMKVLGLILPNKQENILLGTAFGKMSDNSKYLFLYLVKKNHKNVFYILDNKRDYFKLRDKYSVLYKWSIKTFFKVLNAKYFCYTHNVSDIYPIKNYQTKAINLWHGTALKYSGFDSEVDLEWIKRKQRLKMKLPYEEMDYFVTSHENVNFLFKSAMKIEDNKLLPFGLPRNDFLFENKNNINLIKKLKNDIFKSNKQTILYAPTFRDKEFNKEEINRLINFLKNYSDEYTIGIRMHPLESSKLNIDAFNGIINLNSHDDIQEIFLATDILITDYSSMIFDYSILQKPIFLYLYDYEAYKSSRGGFYFDFDKDFKGYGICYNLDKLKELFKSVDEYRNKNFHKKYNKKKSSKSICQFLIRRYNEY